MKHLIIGATSGLGRAIAKTLCDLGEEVKVFVRKKDKGDKYFSDISSAEIIIGDAANFNEVDSAARDMDILYYCVNIPYNQWKEKAKPLLAVSIEAAYKNNVKMIFPGNVYIYGRAQTITVKENHPADAHTKKGKIRIDMERMIFNAGEENNLRFSIIRMPDFYGPYVINGFSEKMFHNALTGKPIQWYGNLDVTIEFIFIEDAAKAIAAAAMSDKSTGKTFNVPGYSLTTPREFLSEISKQGYKSSKIKTLNSKFIIGLGGIFSPLAREFNEMIYLKRERFILDGTMYKSVLGTIPATPYKEGIKKTLRWAKNYYNIKQ